VCAEEPPALTHTLAYAVARAAAGPRSIEQLSDPAVKKEDDLGERGRVPTFHVRLPGAPDTRRATQRIWGLTGMHASSVACLLAACLL